MQTPVLLFIMRMAEAFASSAKFALAVKLQPPLCTRIASPVSYRKARHPTIISKH